MSQGQPTDRRPMRRLRSTDYYVAKASLEVPAKTKWDKCELCGLEITGKSYRGSRSDKVICQECWNEKVIG